MSWLPFGPWSGVAPPASPTCLTEQQNATLSRKEDQLQTRPSSTDNATMLEDEDEQVPTNLARESFPADDPRKPMGPDPSHHSKPTEPHNLPAENYTRPAEGDGDGEAHSKNTMSYRNLSGDRAEANTHASISARSSSQESLREQWGDWQLEPETGWGTNYRNQHPFLRDFQELISSRSDFASVRLRLRSLRKGLRFTRDTIDERENQFMQLLKAFVGQANRQDPTAIMHEAESLRDARDKFRDQEAEYDMLEEEVISDEYQLNESERKLYKRAMRTPDHQSFVDDASSFGAVSTIASAITRRANMAVSGVTERWSARIRAKRLLESRLQDMQAEYRTRLDDQEMRLSNDLPLDEESKVFLLEFGAVEAKLREELAFLHDGLARLQQIKDDQADSYFALHQFSDVPLSPSTPETSEFDPTRVSELEEASDPLLLDKDDTSPVFPSSISGPPTQHINMDTYINDWMLHKLRVSLWEIYYFRYQVGILSLTIGKEQFKVLVLTQWQHDDVASSYHAQQQEAASFEPAISTEDTTAFLSVARSDPGKSTNLRVIDHRDPSMLGRSRSQASINLHYLIRRLSLGSL